MTNTVTVSIELRNESEIVLHAQFLAALLQSRASAPAYIGEIPAATSGPAGPASPWSPPIAATSEARDPSVVADISPDSVERLFREYIRKNGTPAARKLLDKYNAQRLINVPQERLAEFVAEISR